jgi:hypothetical protein
MFSSNFGIESGSRKVRTQVRRYKIRKNLCPLALKFSGKIKFERKSGNFCRHPIPKELSRQIMRTLFGKRIRTMTGKWKPAGGYGQRNWSDGTAKNWFEIYWIRQI